MAVQSSLAALLAAGSPVAAQNPSIGMQPTNQLAQYLAQMQAVRGRGAQMGAQPMVPPAAGMPQPQMGLGSLQAALMPYRR